MHGPEHPATATCLSNLAALLHKQGNYAEARALYERALLIYERAVGPDHLDAAKSLNNLALLLKEQGAYAEARALYERALMTFERVLEPNHSLIRTTQAALAKLDDHLRAGQA